MPERGFPQRGYARKKHCCCIENIKCKFKSSSTDPPPLSGPQQDNKGSRKHCVLHKRAVVSRAFNQTMLAGGEHD